MTHDLHHLFNPRSIAMIGISTNPAKFGGGFWTKVLQGMGYTGNIYPVSPKLNEFSGLKVYPSIRDIPSSVDLTSVTIPAQNTPQLMEDCAAKGVKGASLFTGGFSETGEEAGIRLESEITQIARRGGVRLIGPNCPGIYCPKGRVSFGSEFPRESGPVGYMCQGGGNSFRLILEGANRGIRFSKAISHGNACDLNQADFLEYFTRDPETEIIAIYVEGVRDGERFVEALSKAAKVKPVILLKGGRTEAGSRAASSHTGAITGNEAAWDALCRRTAVVRLQACAQAA